MIGQAVLVHTLGYFIVCAWLSWKLYEQAETLFKGDDVARVLYFQSRLPAIALLTVGWEITLPIMPLLFNAHLPGRRSRGIVFLLALMVFLGTIVLSHQLAEASYKTF